MKKSTVLVIALGALAILGFFAIVLIRDSGKSDAELLDFAIKDTLSIDKIIVTDHFGMKMELVKTQGVWETAKGDCVPQPQVQIMLQAIATIRFKGYVPLPSQKNVINRMAAQNIKVEIYQNGEWSKTWYIGSATSDHLGQYMLLETANEGKSDLPVVMTLNGFSGVIESRFYADPRKWVCSEIFNLGLDEIKMVDVKFDLDPTSNFKITKNGTNFTATQNGVPFPSLDTNMLFRYLLNYKKIHFNIANYVLDPEQVDSLRKSKPFCRLTVSEQSGKVTKLPLHYVGLDYYMLSPSGDTLKYDVDNLWTFLPNGEPVQCQFYVFSPIILGHIYFPFMNQNGPSVMPKN